MSVSNTHSLPSFSSYCLSQAVRRRLPTREVRIGELYLGATHPIRVQSMTTADTLNTKAVVEESIRMIEAGCELVRITAPSKSEAENLLNIKNELRKRGYTTPLVADIHFTPNAAEIAARIVEKVRVNPGNYADKKKFETIEYTEAAYQAELERIHKRFAPLVKICKEHGTAMRIGTNHGSLSDRIMSRWGDTPEGMVESAMEFVRICEDLGYYDLVISMKASNVLVMVQAYRLLAKVMLERQKEGRDCYPLHVGVTEAGDGEDGRIKSALGIGTLLADGLGDTVRVSLTEPAEAEMPVGRLIVRFYEEALSTLFLPEIEPTFNPFVFERRKTSVILNFGGEHPENVPRIISDFAHKTSENPLNEADLRQVGHYYSLTLDKFSMTDMGTDWIYAGNVPVPFMLPNGLKTLYDYSLWREKYCEDPHAFPYFSSIGEWISAEKHNGTAEFVGLSVKDFELDTIILRLVDTSNTIAVLEAKSETPVQELRYMAMKLTEIGFRNPMIVRANVTPRLSEVPETDAARLQLTAACTVGQMCIDGLVDGLWLYAEESDIFSPETLNRAAFGILQAVRQRITKTEYISCPSCGRTLFDLQETTAMIRSRTEHLKGVKIGIMGCIVNGPGEMADADYGYVGSGLDMITLYRGKEVVESKVRTAEAVDKLIEIIREDGNWVERS